MKMGKHEHHYIFLRQEIRPTVRWGDRVHERIVEDVFFCEGCLDYRRITVRREVPNPTTFGWMEVAL
jgi:hypothetical protein